MGLNFYLGQVFSVGAWSVLLISYWRNKDNKILYLQIVSCIFFLLNYIFLGAYTGLFVIFFEMIRDILYINFKNDRKIYMLTIPIYILIGIFSYDGVWSIFSVLAALNDGYALIYKGNKVVFLGIITYLLWMVYDLYCLNYMSVLAEFVLICSNIFVLIRGNDMINARKGEVIRKT